MGILSWNIETTGQFASVLLQTASSFCFLSFEATVTFRFTPVNLGESAGLSASATTSILVILTLDFLATSANIVTAQSASAIIESSSAEGPVLSPPFAVPRSSTMLCPRLLSAIDWTFSTSFAFTLIFGIFHQRVCYIIFSRFKVTV